MDLRAYFYDLTMRVTAMIFCCFLSLMAVTVWNSSTVVEPDISDTPQNVTYNVYLTSAEDFVRTEPVPDLNLVDETVEDEPEDEGYQFTEEEIKLIATLTMAEAGNQSELGKRLVIDSVLNRLEHPNFPKTVREVIYQTNQYSPATNGTIDRYYATEEHIQLVREEIERRTDSEVIFFRAGKYGNYGTPLYCVGDHYFSSYD